MVKTKRGFTLTEVLIAIGIIGVVATLTIPQLINKFSTDLRKNQIKVFEKKFNQATSKMNIDGKIGPYYGSTKEFVNELSQTMKISFVCDPSSGTSLSKCWTYNNVKNDDGTTFEINDVRIGETAFNLNDDFMEVIGIVTGNGTPMLLSFNRECENLDPDSSYEEGETSRCVAGVYDINGAKGPNKYGEDIISFNANGFGSSCYFKIGGTCYSGIFNAPGLSTDECIKLKREGKLIMDKECCTSEDISYCATMKDYWAGAAYKCGGQNNMVSREQLLPLLKELYSGADINKRGWTKDLIVDKDSDAYKYTELTTKYSFTWTKDKCVEPYKCSDFRIQSDKTLPYTDNIWNGGGAAICVIN